MINIPDSVKEVFLRDSSNKKLTIEIVNPDELELNELNYSKIMSWSDNFTASIGWGTFKEVAYLKDKVDFRGLERLKYIRASLYLKISNITSNPGTLAARVTYMRGEDAEYLDKTFNISDFTSDYVKLDLDYTQSILNNVPLTEIRRIELWNNNQISFNADVSLMYLQVEMSDTTDGFLNKYSNHYSMDYDLDAFRGNVTIGNDHIEFESFSLTESLCSQDNIKFGLCEAAHCNVTVVTDADNLIGREMKAFIGIDQDVTYEKIAAVNWHNDQSGYMTPGRVFTETRQGFGWTYEKLIDTVITDYTEYFEEYGNLKVVLDFKIDSYSGDIPSKIYFTLFGHNIDNEQVRYDEAPVDFSEYTSDYVTLQFNIPYIKNSKPLKDVERIYIWKVDGGTFEVTYSIKDIGIYIADEAEKTTPAPEYDPEMCLVYNGEIDDYLADEYRIPLGVFNITDVKLQHNKNLIKKQITAYDNLVKLEQNAANWYTQYMFGFSFDEYYVSTDRIEFARQIYATYFNYMNAIGIEKRTQETLIASYDRGDLTVNPDYYFTWNPEEEGSVYDAQYRMLAFYKVNIPNIDPSKIYAVYKTNKNNMTDEQLLNDETYVTNQYKVKVDALGRGITSGSILVEALDSNGDPIVSYCLDSGDYFPVPSTTDSINIYIRAGLVNINGSHTDITGHEMLGTLKVYETQKQAQLVNKEKRLVYYNLGNGTINPTDSSITGRDVVRSLLELCGCFFRLNRSTGQPEFVYCTKSGLYPRNDLYPDDDLYPRAGSDQIVPNGRYISVLQDDYQVKDFGKIQIVVDTRTNDTKSVCVYQYPTISESINAYIIKDNIFLCPEEAYYDPESLALDNILESMFMQISNMGYVPNITEALGMPWIECGDRIGILTFNSGFESFIFRRTLKGIQLLIDTFESTGDEYTEAIKEFGYELYN